MVKVFIPIHGISNVCVSRVVINPHNRAEDLRYLAKCRECIEEVLIDTGVHKLFHKLNVRDYPPWYITQYVSFVKEVVLRFSNVRIYYVIPDIPVDYDGRESLYPWNVERTVEYITLFRDRYIDSLKPAVPIAVVQGKKDDVGSVINAYFKYEYLYSEFEMVGIGPTCTSKNWRKLALLLLSCERHIPRPFHSFGAHLAAVKKVLEWSPRRFRSFDTSAFHWVGTSRSRNRREREESLLNYLSKLREVGVEVPKIALPSP